MELRNTGVFEPPGRCWAQRDGCNVVGGVAGCGQDGMTGPRGGEGRGAGPGREWRGPGAEGEAGAGQIGHGHQVHDGLLPHAPVAGYEQVEPVQVQQLLHLLEESRTAGHQGGAKEEVAEEVVGISPVSQSTGGRGGLGLGQSIPPRDGRRGLLSSTLDRP